MRDSEASRRTVRVKVSELPQAAPEVQARALVAVGAAIRALGRPLGADDGIDVNIDDAVAAAGRVTLRWIAAEIEAGSAPLPLLDASVHNGLDRTAELAATALEPKLRAAVARYLETVGAELQTRLPVSTEPAAREYAAALLRSVFQILAATATNTEVVVEEDGEPSFWGGVWDRATTSRRFIKTTFRVLGLGAGWLAGTALALAASPLLLLGATAVTTVRRIDAAMAQARRARVQAQAPSDDGVNAPV
jgi:hypothetical protein